ncbi:hypothetical protein D0Q02_30480 [Micromonospora craniellae]|uniref:Uncharacterized protein n=1 Tax=Micromonospora craniellae TaxID=2294034 RepID=A0A372FQJ9_9ACTN|nr:hypothetical protein D0Q02_30480 [Micromonospora craniellae]
MDGGVLVLGDDDDSWLVHRLRSVADGDGVMSASACGEVGGVEVGEMHSGWVWWQESQVVSG